MNRTNRELSSGEVLFLSGNNTATFISDHTLLGCQGRTMQEQHVMLRSHSDKSPFFFYFTIYKFTLSPLSILTRQYGFLLYKDGMLCVNSQHTFTRMQFCNYSETRSQNRKVASTFSCNNIQLLKYFKYVIEYICFPS